MLRVINPADGSLLREVAEDDAADIAAKFAAARASQPHWASRPLDERIAIGRRFAGLLAERTEDLARTLTSEMGKPIRQARNELNAMQGRLAFFLDHVARATADEPLDPRDGVEERIAWEPLGVIANISAWNYPWFVGSNVFMPALLTGNAVLYKPSEHATLTGLAIGDLWRDAGLPSDLFAVIVGAGQTGARVLEQDIDGVFFTGSYATGRRIAEAAGPRMMRLQVELGGKDPAYVADDVDAAAAAAAIADGAFYNAGQSCCAVERVYAHHRVAPAFVDAFVAAVRAFKVGDPTDETTYLGPLARAGQLDVLEDQVRDAVAQGAKLLTGGARRGGAGWYFEPTVLAGVDHRMKVMREESFGPIIGIQEVAGDDEAVARMNDTEYGLTASVYTRDGERARRVLSQVNAGTVYWNCCDRVSPQLPWTGRRHSGIGSTLSVAGIRAFVQPKAWHLKAGC